MRHIRFAPKRRARMLPAAAVLALLLSPAGAPQAGAAAFDAHYTSAFLSVQEQRRRCRPSSRMLSPFATVGCARASAPRRCLCIAGSIAASIGVSAGAKTTRSERAGSCIFRLFIKHPSSALSYAAEGFFASAALRMTHAMRKPAFGDRFAP